MDLPSSKSTYAMLVMPLLIAMIGFPAFTLMNRESSVVSEAEIMALFGGSRDWGLSTTSLPISSISIKAKSLLSTANVRGSAPVGLEELYQYAGDTVPLHALRSLEGKEVLKRLIQLCEGERRCEFGPGRAHNEREWFGMTPLHLAYYTGANLCAEYMIAKGADVDALDNAGRKPANLSFSSFLQNAKLAASARGSTCELPELDLDSSDMNSTIREFKRLISEGEPVILRNFLQLMDPDYLSLTIDEIIQNQGDTFVNVAAVPYASYFGVNQTRMTLHEYFTEHMLSTPIASYIFEKNEKLTSRALQLLSRFSEQALPDFFQNPLQLGTENIHYFLGSAESGAPLHIHSDAFNLVVSGSKDWLVYPPSLSLYSRLPVKQWMDEYLDKLPVQPLRCHQKAGDLIYVPFDWAHAVINTHNKTFGFALELLNRRDSFDFLRT